MPLILLGPQGPPGRKTDARGHTARGIKPLGRRRKPWRSRPGRRPERGARPAGAGPEQAHMKADLDLARGWLNSCCSECAVEGGRSKSAPHFEQNWGWPVEPREKKGPDPDLFACGTVRIWSIGLQVGAKCATKSSNRAMKNKVTVVSRHGKFYTVRFVSSGKPSVRGPQQTTGGGNRISAEEAAQRIAQRFGKSLAVLAD